MSGLSPLPFGRRVPVIRPARRADHVIRDRSAVPRHIPDKGQVMVRYYGLYANAHGGKVKKASLSPAALRVVEEEPRRLPSQGWAAMIRKVYEVDPLVCPKYGSRMKVVAFLTEVAYNFSVDWGQAQCRKGEFGSVQ